MSYRPPDVVVHRAIATIPMQAIESMSGARGSNGAGAAGSSDCHRMGAEVSQHGISVYISLGNGWYVCLYFRRPEEITTVTEVSVAVAAVVAAAGRYVGGESINLPGAIKVTCDDGSTCDFTVAGGDAAWDDYDRQWRSRDCPMSVVLHRGWGPRNFVFDHSVAYGL